MTDRETRRQQYAKKLKDPRWQKKRLQVLERDGWACQECGDTEETLHVHHKRYADGDPWDTPDEWLTALCAMCHEAESEMLPGALKHLTDAFRTYFNAGDIDDLACAFEYSNIHEYRRSSGILRHFLMSPEHIQQLQQEHEERAERNRKAFYARVGKPNGESE